MACELSTGVGTQSAPSFDYQYFLEEGCFAPLLNAFLTISLDNPPENRYNTIVNAYASVAQWIRVFDFGSEGRGFESLRGHPLYKQISLMVVDNCR